MHRDDWLCGRGRGDRYCCFDSAPGSGVQRRSCPHVADISSSTARSDRHRCAHRRGGQCRRRIKTGYFLSAVSAAAAVSGWLAHSKGRAVSRQGDDPGTGAWPRRLHRCGGWVPHQLAHPGDASRGRIRACRDRLSHRSNRGIRNRRARSDPPPADAYPRGRIPAQ